MIKPERIDKIKQIISIFVIIKRCNSLRLNIIIPIDAKNNKKRMGRANGLSPFFEQKLIQKESSTNTAVPNKKLLGIQFCWHCRKAIRIAKPIVNVDKIIIK